VFKFSRLDSAGQFTPTNEAVFEVSYRMAPPIVECKRTLSVGEDMIKQCLVVLLGSYIRERWISRLCQCKVWCKF
jgi:hypothetical protein